MLEYWSFIHLRRNTPQRTVAQAADFARAAATAEMARRRLAAGMTRGASACAARRQGELRRNSALIPRLRGRSRYVAAKARSLLRGASLLLGG
jgi:hypothetical protein